jgi:hypothetical protein
MLENIWGEIIVTESGITFLVTLQCSLKIQAKLITIASNHQLHSIMTNVMPPPDSVTMISPHIFSNTLNKVCDWL